MEKYIVIAILIPGTKDLYEDHRILSEDMQSQIPKDYKIVFGPASLEDCSKFLISVGREKAASGNSMNWFGLTVAQYALIALVTVTFVSVIVIGALKLQGLSPTETANLVVTADDSARILITFLVAVATVAIAFLAILTAMMLREYKERFALAKEVLTILVGILGTIVGFYFGTAGIPKSGSNVNANANATANVNSRTNTNVNSNANANANAGQSASDTGNSANMNSAR